MEVFFIFPHEEEPRRWVFWGGPPRIGEQVRDHDAKTYEVVGMVWDMQKSAPFITLKELV